MTNTYKLRSIFNSVLAVCFLTALSFYSASAETYYKHVTNLADTCSNFGVSPADLKNSEVPVDYVDLSYDDVTKLLTVEVKVHRDATSGKLAEMFHFGISDGPMPAGEGSIAHIYFDASGVSPKVSIYAYNARGMPIDNDPLSNDDDTITNDSLCGNAKPTYTLYSDLGNLDPDDDIYLYLRGGSWSQANQLYAPLAPLHVLPDVIYNNTDHPTYFQETSKTQIASDTFLYRLVLKTEDLNAWEPTMFYDAFCPPSAGDNYCRSYTYKGAKFSDKMGIWFWALSGATASYYPNGSSFDLTAYGPPSGLEIRSVQNFINNLDTSSATCAICDNADFETKRSPRCDGVTLSSAQVVVGKEVTISLIANDPDSADTEEITPVTVNYTGAPTGARLDPEEGAAITNFDSKGIGSADIIWVPVLNDVGEHTISAQFFKDYGLTTLSSAPGDCQINLRVFANCDPIDPGSISEADNNALRIKDISIELDRYTKRKLNQIRKADGEDPIKYTAPLDGVNTTALWQSSWGIFNSMVAKDTGSYSHIECIQGCNSSVNSFNISASVTSFKSEISDLHDVTLKRVKAYTRALRSYYIKVKGYKPRRAKKRANTIAERYKNGEDMINENYSGANDQIDTYVAIYGTERVKCGQ